MFTVDWWGGLGAGGWLLIGLLWGASLAVVVWAIARMFPRDGPRRRWRK
jgi:hypothetical protein